MKSEREYLKDNLRKFLWYQHCQNPNSVLVWMAGEIPYPALMMAPTYNRRIFLFLSKEVVVLRHKSWSDGHRTQKSKLAANAMLFKLAFAGGRGRAVQR